MINVTSYWSEVWAEPHLPSNGYHAINFTTPVICNYETTSIDHSPLVSV